jgi:hypothetical protein
LRVGHHEAGKFEKVVAGGSRRPATHQGLEIAVVIMAQT